ncbi:hypothetical protein LZZ85_16935 [Terrimonas sp. NA20]|uniref:Lipoprotein n=1 Tax=Terrimonas ginsenosidimutans TaxID=2908004 RepID=A0ABS9KUM7_9BACT|nr:hypothetical protein [Terrimonas ginsenosidimutans]MCG2615985.1 hypothetical protein [Terrimonas ginsenosidimutans]
MKSLMAGSLLFSAFFCSCSPDQDSGKAQIEKIAVAVKSSPVFAKSDLRDFQKLDTLFITANELPKYRRLLDDMHTCDDLLKEAESIRDGKSAANNKISCTIGDLGEFIETVRSDRESKKDELTDLIDNATDTIYKVQCIENIKSSSNVVSPTQATVYVNSHFKVIDYDH